MTASWYFDFISPYSYLQWQRVRAIGVPLAYRPVLFAALLGHHGQKGPVEIEGKRKFTYRFVQWRADRAGVPLKFPPQHPFNPLAALRLCVAAGCSDAAIEAIFNHLWREGRRGDTAESLEDVAAALGIEDTATAVSAPAVKAALRHNFDTAIASDVFGVPSIVAEGKVFWGEDATGMFEEFLDNPGLFDTEEMRRLRDLPAGARRRAVGATDA